MGLKTINKDILHVHNMIAVKFETKLVFLLIFLCSGMEPSQSDANHLTKTDQVNYVANIILITKNIDTTNFFLNNNSNATVNR